MRTLSGQVPMFPLWTYGYWQSKERYKSQDELLDVVRRYRELQVPLDGIIQDWQYWGSNYTWNAMEFLHEDFRWMDSTDPDCFNPKESDYDHPAGDGTWRRYRNAFPLATVSGVYDSQRQVTSDKRVFIMTRSAFAGQQRYGSGLWSGDVTSSWQCCAIRYPSA